MKLLAAICLLLPALHSLHAAPPLTGYPFTDESLSYTVTGPGGVPLGAAHLTSRHTSTGWTFGFTIEGGLPAYPIGDSYRSEANADSCSVEFMRQFSHGARKGSEKESVDRSHEIVTRTTATVPGGGKSDFAVSDCIKDALTFLFYSRRELGQGRVPPAQQILFGGLYDARLDYAGPQDIPSGGKSVVTDKVLCTIKGPASAVSFEIYFARDAARTPLLVKAPFPMGSFSMELSR